MVKEERMRLGSGSASILQGGKAGELRLRRADDTSYTLVTRSALQATLHTLSTRRHSARECEACPGFIRHELLRFLPAVSACLCSGRCDGRAGLCSPSISAQ